MLNRKQVMDQTLVFPMQFTAARPSSFYTAPKNKVGAEFKVKETKGGNLGNK
jgi:hypothetical protein